MSLPLEGIRVLDLTRLLPGPYCSLLLADFGADVIKVEHPEVGDYARWSSPKVGDQSALFLSLNRNKRSITLNLKEKEDQEVFLELVKTADVVLESFRPGVMERLGLGYEVLKKQNPKLIYCAITGYGQTGPMADEPGHDLNFLSYSGLLHLQGQSGEKPMIPSVQIGDIGGGALMAAVGVLVSIIDAQKSSEGQFVDISMLDGVISWMQTILPDRWASAEPLPDRGELLLNGGKAAYEVYRTRDNRFLSVGALEFKFWKNFCEGIGREEFIDKLDAPIEEQRRMKIGIEQSVLQKTLKEWMSLFEGVDACVAPVLTPEEMARHEQVKQREMVEEVTHPQLGLMKTISNPIKLSGEKGKIRHHPPQLGEHNEEILREIGYSNQKVTKGE